MFSEIGDVVGALILASIGWQIISRLFDDENFFRSQGFRSGKVFWISVIVVALIVIVGIYDLFTSSACDAGVDICYTK